MRRSRLVTLAPALLVVLAAALASCHGADDPPTDAGASAPTGTRATQSPDTPQPADTPDPGAPSTAPTTPTTLPRAATTPPRPSTTTGTASPATTPPTAAGAQPDEPRFVCPDGGMDDVAALQRSVDQGHQPWRLSAEDVAAACTFGLPDASVEPVGPDRYRVTDLATGETALVDLARPLGPGTIWVVTARSASG